MGILRSTHEEIDTDNITATFGLVTDPNRGQDIYGAMGDSTTADSYIGSLISLTSKSEIRYEGILYTIDTHNSTIALQDVQSFGTEGRKKDGPQISPSDKVYEYIVFRGSDIKDLQVKFSPPVQTASQIHTDPAIISLQSEYSQPGLAPAAFGTIGSGSLPDLNSHGAHSVAPTSPFPGSTPLYQAGGSIGLWGTLPPPPGVNGTGLAMPPYWPGYYGPSGGLPHVQQQAMHFPRSQGTPIPHAIQQQSQQSSSQASLPMALSTSSDFARPLQQPHNLTLSSTESSSVVTPIPVVSVPSTSKVITVSDGVSMPSLSTESVAPGLLPIVTLGPSNQEVSAIVTPVSAKPHTIMGSTSSFQAISQSVPTTVASGPLGLPTSVAPALVTPGQLLQPGGSVSSFKSPSSTHEQNVGNAASPQLLISGSSDAQSQKISTQPLLPLPKTTGQQRLSQQVNGMVGHPGINPRGRGKGRGRGAPHAVAQFMEDFDFIAMNEKFNKDEVWGHLGKGESRDKAENGEDDDTIEGHVEYEEDLGQSSKSDPKPIYVKDDFFDSLSCDALGRGLRTERTKFSEQRKIDTETFGNFALRSRVGRGGRGGGHQGNFRGSYYGGRGNGYTGRGRAGGRTVL